MFKEIKSSLIDVYYYFKYPESRGLKKKGIRFDHYRELNCEWLKKISIQSIFDVGANEGQFAKLSREVFPSATIYSFEPLPDCFEKLKSALTGDSKFFAYNIAAGSSESEIEFYRSIHSPSSSFLQMEDVHKEAFPESRKGQVKEAILVKVNTLDAIYDRIKPAAEILLKIDVQGFEKEVLLGSQSMMNHVKVVIMEMSFVKLYKDQPLFHDIYMMMYERGFRFHGTLSQMLHPLTREVVQIDAIFVKE